MLFRHRWAIRIIAAVAKTNGSRFVVLKHELDVSADSLSKSLAWLTAEGWLMKNPGYGHPLRPEYVLTDKGRTIAKDAVTFSEASVAWQQVIYRRWSTPTLVAMYDGARHFNDIQQRLATITPRALAQGLRNLTLSDLVRRSVREDFPPRTEYALTDSGVLLASAGKPLVFAA